MNRSVKSALVALVLGAVCMSVATDSEARRRWGSRSYSSPKPAPKPSTPAPTVIHQNSGGSGFMPSLIGGAIGASMMSGGHPREEEPRQANQLPQQRPNTGDHITPVRVP